MILLTSCFVARSLRSVSRALCALLMLGKFKGHFIREILTKLLKSMPSLRNLNQNSQNFKVVGFSSIKSWRYKIINRTKITSHKLLNVSEASAKLKNILIHKIGFLTNIFFIIILLHIRDTGRRGVEESRWREHSNQCDPSVSSLIYSLQGDEKILIYLQ